MSSLATGKALCQVNMEVRCSEAGTRVAKHFHVFTQSQHFPRVGKVNERRQSINSIAIDPLNVL